MKFALVVLVCVVMGGIEGCRIFGSKGGVDKSEEEGRKELQWVINYVNNDVKQKQLSDGKATYVDCKIKSIRGICDDFLLFDVIVTEKRFKDGSIVKTTVENEENFGYVIFYSRHKRKWDVR